MELLADGCMDFLGGQDASKIPDRVPQNAYYAGVNVSTKRGALQPRFGFERLPLSFPEGGIKNRYDNFVSYEEVFRSGKFQGRIPLKDGRALIVVSGVIFVFNYETYKLSVIEITDGSTLNSRARRLNISDAGEYIVIHDYPGYPVIVDGFTARRADPTKQEVPVSTLGVFAQNRFIVANAGNEFTAGDAVGNMLAPDAPLTFQEVFTLGSPYYGQIFSLPSSRSQLPITAMGTLEMNDTSTGIGPLVIANQESIFAYLAQNPRASWDQSQFGSRLVSGSGIVGPRALVNVNSDMYYLDKEGHVRSLTMSRNEQGRLARVPLSREVDNWIVAHDESLLSLAFAGYFRNKLFFSVNPFRTVCRDIATGLNTSDFAFGGLVVLELDNITQFGQSGNPTWAGLWTGVYPMDMFTVGNRTFIIAKNGGNQIYEINPELTYDTADDVVRQIRSVVYTREHDFQNNFQLKTIHSADFNFDNMQGDFSLKVDYKPSHEANFLYWGLFKHTIPWRTDKLPEYGFMEGFSGQQIRDLSLGNPEQVTNSDVTGDYSTSFKKLQLKLEITGKYWELHEYKIKATPQQQNELIYATEINVVPTPKQPSNDWTVEEF